MHLQSQLHPILPEAPAFILQFRPVTSPCPLLRDFACKALILKVKCSLYQNQRVQKFRLTLVRALFC